MLDVYEEGLYVSPWLRGGTGMTKMSFNDLLPTTQYPPTCVHLFLVLAKPLASLPGYKFSLTLEFGDCLYPCPKNFIFSEFLHIN